MREKYKDICVCQAKSIRDGFFCSFPLLTLIIFSNLGPNFGFWNVNFGFDHKLCIFAKKKKTKIGQIWWFWSNIMDFGKNDGRDWKCGIWDKNYRVTVTKKANDGFGDKKLLNLVKVNFDKLWCVLSKYEEFLSKYDGF